MLVTARHADAERARPLPCRSMRRTKIVATIGPASREPETLVRLVEAGMDVARLNYSHGTLEEHAETVSRVRDAAGRAGRPVAILQDLPGPEAAHRPAARGRRRADAGERLTLRLRRRGDRRRRAPHEHLLGAACRTRSRRDSILYLADGSVRLRVVAVRAADCEVEVEIEVGGAVASRQGLNIPGPVDSLPAVPEEDLHLLRHGESIGVDMVALSFVQKPEDVEFVREHTRLPLIAKMEKPQAVERAEEIVKAADCVMVARGDLGIELPIERVPLVQKQLLELAGLDGAAVDHRHADARLDGQLLAPHARRGGRRRQRDPRRHRRGDALAGDRDRRLPGRGGRDDGRGGRAGRVDRAV